MAIANLESIGMNAFTPNYLVVGHMTCDIVPEGCLAGGTVSYSGRMAQALGYKTAVVTSAKADEAWQTVFPNISVHNIPAPQTTTFENIYTAAGRRQRVHAIANPITAVDIPATWQRAPVVHLGPLVGEVDPDIIHLFSNSSVGLTPQGWLRRWHDDGVVYAQAWPEAEHVLPLAAAVILSKEDLLDDAMLTHYRQWSKLLVLTMGWDGCTIFMGDEVRTIPAPKVKEVEPTGAGDIFATAFLIRLHQTGGNPWEAGRFANEIASLSVTCVGLNAKIEQIQNLIKK